jgi:putative membrane protein
VSHLRTSRPTRALAAVAALGAAVALGASSPAAPASAAAAAPSAQDVAYLQFAARANLSEIAQGQLAKKQAGDPALRAFGKDMVKDHRKQLAALEQTATALGVALPSRPTKQQRQVARAFSRLDGGTFDCAYVPFQWGDHQLVITMTTTETTAGSDPTVKQAAAASLPVLQEHYEHATMLLGDLRRC